MKNNKVATVAGRGFILLSAFSFLSVSVMAFASPQAVMDLVQIKLTNTDAFSSIRGIYGGVGLALVITLLYLMVKSPTQGAGLPVAYMGYVCLVAHHYHFQRGGFGGLWHPMAHYRIGVFRHRRSVAMAGKQATKRTRSLTNIGQ